jgi:diguanylate cyclase (GGDEF)-like protein
MFSPLLFLVDDEANILSAIRRAMRGAPLSLRAFGSPEEALAALEDEEPAAVISDYRMPGMSGTAFLERFKAACPGATRVLLTGYVDLEASVDSINKGAVYRFVSKPWDDEQLKATAMAAAAESVAGRAAAALPRLFESLLGASSREEAIGAAARYLDEDSGLALALREAAGQPQGTEEGRAEFSIPTGDPGGASLYLSVPSEEIAVFAAAGLVAKISALIESALNGLGISLQAIDARERLTVLSERDPLSGLLNRRAMTARIETECGRLDRYGRPFCVLLIDVDEFKSINDRYGHAKGDAVISGIGRVISEGCRLMDIAARLGGDEFLVGLPETGIEGAADFAGRLKERILALSKELGLDDSLTISIGIAAAPAEASGIDAVLEAADASMYEVKRSGKNGVGVAKPQPEGSGIP